MKRSFLSWRLGGAFKKVRQGHSTRPCAGLPHTRPELPGFLAINCLLNDRGVLPLAITAKCPNAFPEEPPRDGPAKNRYSK